MRPALRYTAWTAGTLTVLLLAAAAALPWWLPTLARHLAARRNVTITELQLGYPGLHGVRIERLAVHAGTTTVRAEGVDLRYGLTLRDAGHSERLTFAQLRAHTATADIAALGGDVVYSRATLGAARVDSANIARLDVTLLPVQRTEPTKIPKYPAELWQLVPLRAAHIAALRVRGTQPEFALAGRGDFDQQRLSAVLSADRPTLAAGTTATLVLTRAGHLTIQLGRAPAAGTPAAGTPGAGMPAAGTPGAGMPAAGTPAAGMPGAGTPAAGMPAAGTPAAGMPAAGMPAAGMPAAVARADIDAVLDRSGRQITVVVAAQLPEDLLSLVSAPLGITTRTGTLDAQLRAQFAWPLPDTLDQAALMNMAKAAAVRGQFALRWRGAVPKRITAADATLLGSVTAHAGSVVVRLDPGAMLTGRLVLAEPLQLFGQTIAPVVALRGAQPLVLELAREQLRMTGNLRARIGTGNATLLADVDALQMPVRAHADAALGDGLTARLRWRADLAQTAFGRFTSGGSAGVALAGSVATLRVAPRATLGLAQLGDWSHSPTTATNAAPFVVQLDTRTLRYRANDLAFTLQLPKATFGATQAAFAASTLTVAHLDGAGARLVTDGALATHATIDKYQLPVSIAGRIALADDVVQLTLQFIAPKSSVRVPFTVQHNLGSGRGALHIDTTIAADSALLKSLLDRWREDYDLDRGRIKVFADLTWRVTAAATRIDGAGNITTLDAQAHYADYLFRGANITADWQLNDRGLSVTKGDARITEAFIGAPVTAITAPFTYQGGVLASPGLRAEVVGGSAATSALRYTIKDGAAAFDVRVQGLSLGKLLALEGGDIDGSGTLDGDLPVTLVSNAPVIHAGLVTARPPGGTIAYAAAGTVAEYARGPGLDFAFNALKDFRFDTLSAGVEYAADSNMKLAVRLYGRNPAVEGGRTIHYNLNVSENVADLLRSLRASTDVSDRFAKRLSQ